MSSRATFRRKIVLPVTVIRHDGQEKQLAHTLDVTSNSARLGGLSSSLEPAEIIEVQRGSAKAKFQVAWMGAADGAMAGQAGIRGLDPNRCIWNVDLPKDEMDPNVDTSNVRGVTPIVHTESRPAGDRRGHHRYACSGSVALRTPGAAYALNGEVKDISKGGLYIELSAPLPINSLINMELCVENIRFEAGGMVRTSYPLLGMGVSFQRLSPESAEKLVVVLERARRKTSRNDTAIPQLDAYPDLQVSDGLELDAAEPEISVFIDPAPMLVKACKKLAEDFDEWKASCSPAEIEEVKLVIHHLQQKFAHTPVEK